MALIVCVETAAPSIMVALGDGERVLYEESPATGRVEGPVFLHGAVCRGLDAIGSKARDIDAVAIDLGPGNLTATRGGVTFANALAWGLAKPLLPLDYFDLVAPRDRGIVNRRLRQADDRRQRGSRRSSADRAAVLSWSMISPDWPGTASLHTRILSLPVS